MARESILAVIGGNNKGQVIRSPYLYILHHMYMSRFHTVYHGPNGSYNSFSLKSNSKVIHLSMIFYCVLVAIWSTRTFDICNDA